jgi:threonine synthase
MGEGGTPLIKADNLGMMLGLPNLFIKDERQGPTGSFKDRQAALTMAVLKEAGQTEAVVASTGNVAISFSAYGARAGVKVWAFLTSLVPPSKMHEVALYGTQVVKVTTTYDQAKRLAEEFANRRGLYRDRGARSIAALEAMKTIGYEIAEQLGQLTPDGGTGWQAPDWYFQAVSGAIGPLGVAKAFRELHQADLVGQLPALGVIQAEGCAPMAKAWQAGLDPAPPINNPQTHISTLSTGDPGRAYSLLRQQLMAQAAGSMQSVSDEAAYEAVHLLAEMEGISCEPAAGVAFAGLIQMVHAGEIDRQAIIVVNCSGHTVPIEEEMLAEGWSQDLDLKVGLPDSPEEGVLAALELLDRESLRQVLVVDDHEDARRLIRRILQSKGDFRLREAETGAAALAMASEDPPDAIVLDLMMPEMDGFEVLERLRGNPQTASIPVVVVTAKSLTGAERRRLEDLLAGLMLKGDFLTDDLLKEIDSALG